MSFSLRQLSLILLSLLLLNACEETVDPFLESDRQVTLFGTLDMARDTQFVRVVPFRESLESAPQDSLDVQFTSHNLTTGQETTWRDSLHRFENGETGHIFYAPLRMQAGHTYRLEVKPTDSDIVTRVETTVPPAPTPFVQREQLQSVTGIDLGSQSIFWEGLQEEPDRIEVWYRFLISESGPFLDIFLPYEPSNEGYQQCPLPDCSNAGWKTTLDLNQDRRTLDTLVSVRQSPLVGLGMRMILLDPQFEPPGGAFDPEVQAQPGAFSNVENGFGFVGSVGRFDVEWTLREESLRRLNYQTLEDAFGKRAPVVRRALRPRRQP